MIMNALYTIISYSLGNLFLGVILTIAGVELMFFLIRSWFSNRTFTLFSYFVGIILFLFLSFQSVLFCGAITIKSYCDEVEMAINEWARNLPDDVCLDTNLQIPVFRIRIHGRGRGCTK